MNTQDDWQRTTKPRRELIYMAADRIMEHGWDATAAIVDTIDNWKLWPLGSVRYEVGRYYTGLSSIGHSRLISDIAKEVKFRKELRRLREFNRGQLEAQQHPAAIGCDDNEERLM